MSQTPTISSSEELCSLVSYALDTALSLGATAAAVEVSEEKGTCVTVRNQETESIEHTHDKISELLSILVNQRLWLPAETFARCRS